MMDLIFRFAWDETGTPAMEYALILALLGIALIASIALSAAPSPASSAIWREDWRGS